MLGYMYFSCYGSLYSLANYHKKIILPTASPISVFVASISSMKYGKYSVNVKFPIYFILNPSLKIAAALTQVVYVAPNY